MAVQSENHKQRYIQYFKNKLNSIYSSGQKDRVYIQQQAEDKKKMLKNYQQEELELLEEINKLHQDQTDAKK